MVLDEPGKDINDPTRGMHERFADMVRLVAGRGVQFLVVTALPELEEAADRAFRF